MPQNRYYKEWSDARRQRAIEYLGSICVRCGSNERLEFDHINGKDKSYPIAKNLNRRWEVLILELNKCQLLCRPCHLAKSKENDETGGGQNKLEEFPHGTHTGYTMGCREECCRAARREYRRNYYLRKGM